MSDRPRHSESHDRAALEAYLGGQGVPVERIDEPLEHYRLFAE